MKAAFALSTLLVSVATVLAAPFDQGEGFISQVPNHSGHNATDAKEWVIMLDKDRPQERTLDTILSDAGVGNDSITYRWDNNYFTGAAVVVGEHCKKAFEAMAEVAQLEEKTTIQSFVTKKDGSPWGLQRISNEAGASGNAQDQDFTYSYEEETLGAGVDIYVIDTGVRTSHAVFTERAQEGFSAFESAVDGDGHGTHVAGTAAGAKFGVAQGANVFAVKVLGDDGSGSSTDTIAGMDWVLQNHEKRKSEPGFVGSIMSMSWGLQGTAKTVDEVIDNAIQAGIHVSVAAGNEGVDACSTTPAHLGGANSAVVTVGSVNIGNEVSSFSNVGKCVDIYAPGEDILSSWATGDNIINYLSGTSMACPHASGVMAYLMAQNPETLGQNPKALKEKLLATAREGAFTGNTGGSANLLLSNGIDGRVSARLVKNYVVPDRKRTVTGSPVSWAKEFVDANVDKRWELHSSEASLRF